MFKLQTSIVFLLFMLLASLGFAAPAQLDLGNQQLLTNYAKALQNAPLLYVQVAQSSTLKAVANEKNTYILTLHQTNPYVTYFSERPKQVTGLITIEDFVKNWKVGTNSFAKTPPNASLEAISADKKQHVNYVVNLQKIHYNPENNTLIYKIKMLSNKKIKPIISQLAFTSLFIDFNWNNTTP